ncbi:MAG: exosortase H [Verrucomicrobiota bacterium]|jgi:exosortase H (IPTLxxWG-CTERM-specific)
MQKSEKNGQSQFGPAHAEDISPKAPIKTSVAKHLKVRWLSWYWAKNPVLRFVVVFGLLLALFYAVVPKSSFHNTVSPPYLRFNTRMASAVCNWFGQHTSAKEATIASARFSLGIAPSCDGSEVLAIFGAAVLAFPAPFRRKIPGILLGAVILAAVNFIRIVSLFLVGVYFHNAFDRMHVEVWPAIFILAAIVLWAVWIQWALKAHPVTSHVPS